MLREPPLLPQAGEVDPPPGRSPSPPLAFPQNPIGLFDGTPTTPAAATTISPPARGGVDGAISNNSSREGDTNNNSNDSRREGDINSYSRAEACLDSTPEEAGKDKVRGRVRGGGRECNICFIYMFFVLFSYAMLCGSL